LIPQFAQALFIRHIQADDEFIVTQQPGQGGLRMVIFSSDV
jgi:hypothetical protein